MIQSPLKILTLIFPIVACFLMAGIHHMNQQKGTLYRIPVAGYDPRDLLRGHYLTYRYDWNWEDKNKSISSHKSAICLNSTDDNPEVILTDREYAYKNCDHFIIGRGSKTSTFKIGESGTGSLTRYYISEKYAKQLDDMLRGRTEEEYDFEIALRVNGAGIPFIAGMYVDDVPLEEWVKANATSNK